MRDCKRGDRGQHIGAVKEGIGDSSEGLPKRGWGAAVRGVKERTREISLGL